MKLHGLHRLNECNVVITIDRIVLKLTLDSGVANVFVFSFLPIALAHQETACGPHLINILTLRKGTQKWTNSNVFVRELTSVICLKLMKTTSTPTILSKALFERLVLN